MWFNKNGNHTEVVEVQRPELLMEQKTVAPLQTQDVTQHTQETTQPTMLIFRDPAQHSESLTGGAIKAYAILCNLVMLCILANVF